LSPSVLKAALQGCGGRDPQSGVACGTVAEVTEWVAKQQGINVDRALHSAVYTRMRNGKVTAATKLANMAGLWFGTLQQGARGCHGAYS
jgi:hypothetical protein